MDNKELRALRLKLDLTQQQMADKLLMSKVMYGLNERGSKTISKRTEKLALEMEKNTVSSALLSNPPST